MLHVRIVSPPGVTARLLDRLGGLPGVSNLIVLEGAAQRPHGDAVFLDVEHRAANPVFRALRGLSLDTDGAITVEQVDASLTTAARPAARIGSPAGEVVSLTEARAGALIGMFISVTTIPAAADIGVSLAFGSWHEAGGSAEQLLLNVVLLIAVGAGGLSAQRAIWRRLGARQQTLPLRPPP